MIPYYLLVIIPTIIYLIGRIAGKKWNKQCICLFFIILLLILSFRGITCGRDLKMYEYFFDTMKGYNLKNILSFSQKGEVLYFILNKLIIKLGGNYQMFLATVAILSIIPIAIFYSKKTDNALLTIALFLTVAPFPMFFSGLRQAIAMGLVVLAFKYVQEQKPVKYIICILAIMLFHISAAVALLFYPIYHSKVNKNWLYIIIPFFLITYIFRTQIFLYLIKFSNTIYQESYGVVTSTGQYTILILLIIFDIFSFTIPDKKKMDKEVIGFRNLLLLATLFQMFVSINMNVMRLNYYALLFIPILIPKIITNTKESYKKLSQFALIIMVVFFMTYFIYNGYVGNNNLDIFPYVPFWR